MVTGLKLSDLREKRPGADSSDRCSCYARNVNACCAFRKRAGGFFFSDIYGSPLLFRTVLIQKDVKKIQARESSAVHSAG